MDNDALWEEDPVQVDPLTVGLTRPAKVGGVPMQPFMLGMLIGVLVFLGTGNPLYLLVDLPVYGILRVISANNPRIFGVIAAWIRVNARCNNRVFWGGVASFSPRRTARWE
jgi:type IV secretory pathway VirB3-like protein